MRVLVVAPGPAFSVEDVCRGWVRALRQLGATVARFNLGDRLDFYASVLMERDGEYMHALSEPDAVTLAAKGVTSAAYEFWPHLVVVISGFYVSPAVLDLLRHRGKKVVLIHTESPYEDERQLSRAAHADLNVINDPTNLARYREIAPTIYLSQAHDPEVHHPRLPDPGLASDFCFVGTGYPSRVEFFEAVDWSGIDVTLAGNWQGLQVDEESPLRQFVAHDLDRCVSNDEAVDLYAATQASANLYRREAERPELAQGWSMSPREIELAACGTFFLREPRGEGDEVLAMLPTFDGPEDFGAKLRWWLDHSAQREEAARAARAAVADRTFLANAQRLLAALG